MVFFSSFGIIFFDFLKIFEIANLKLLFTKANICVSSQKGKKGKEKKVIPWLFAYSCLSLLDNVLACVYSQDWQATDFPVSSKSCLIES